MKMLQFYHLLWDGSWKKVFVPNGLHLKKDKCSFRVIGIIYEARPNVIFDVFRFALKVEMLVC